MRRNLLQENNSGSLSKALFANLMGFILVLLLSFGLSYAYFSDKVEVSGGSNLGVMKVLYCQNLADAEGSSVVYGTINDGLTAVDLTSINIAPGDTLNIKGYAVNNGNIDVFVLGRLEVAVNNADGELETEVVWYNVATGQAVYVERGLFQVGASVLYSSGTIGDTQEINASYVFEGDRYINNYKNISIKFELFGYQAEFLDFANDFDMDVKYNSYITKGANKNIYSEDSKKLVCHYITDRMRDVWTSADANISGVLSDLTTDSSGAYLINSCADWMLFRHIAQTQSNTQGKTFKLNCYLDFNNTSTAINLTSFYGDFDGQGYTLSNISATGAGVWGLFESSWGSISNLGVDGLKLNRSYTGTDVFVVGGIAGYLNQAEMTNCFVIGASVYDSSIDYDVVATTTTTTDVCVGGIVGNMRGDNVSSAATATISNCYAIINIQASAGNVGGIVGEAYPSYCSVEHSYFSGKISGGSHCGAIVGQTGSCGEVANCFAEIKELTNSNSSVMIGYGVSTATINCAYLKDGVITKEGQNQTEQTITESTFKSIGKLRDVLDWDATVWATDIYHTTKGLPVLRVFYNF